MVWGEDLFSVRRIARGLPIGNLTSQFWANVYLNALDHFVKHELRCKGYVRYMDDFLLFGHDKATLKAQGKRVKQWVSNPLRLEMLPDKYHLLTTRPAVPFCGAANKKAPPAVSSHSERRGRCCFFPYRQSS